MHPWEGADNSPRFDRALARLDVDDVVDIERTDRREIDASERPTDSDYARYLYLVRALRAQEYRPTLGDTPFVFVDLTFNSILAAAEADLAVLWGELGGDGGRASDAATRVRDALAERWDDERAVYVEDDSDAPADETVDALFPLYAGAPDRRAGAPSVRRGALVACPLRSLARGAVAGDDGFEVELGVRSSPVLARAGLGEHQLVLHPRARAGGARPRRPKSCGA